MLEKYYLDREEVLLLIIDIQGRLLPAMKHREDVVKNTNILINSANILEIPMIVTEQYPEGLGNTVEEIKENFNYNTIVLEKMNFSAYCDDIKEAIINKQKKKIIISGIESHICVFQTARDLLRDGYEVYIALDAISSRSEVNYNNSLDLFKDMGAIVMNTEAILFNILQTAGTEEFKKISKIIK
ncbi:MAG: isochorismatase family protein [Andreesenia angusta]|nr:isochorismatase family protein [Andreesenia angusta]